MNGGEARQVSALAQGVSDYSWRPDGGMFLAQSPWKPGDEPGNDGSDEVATITTVYRRLGELWGSSREGRYQQLWLLPLEGEAQRITSEPVHLVQASWSPDGREIAFCANRRSDPDVHDSMALWVLTLASGQMRRLTPEEGKARMPSWSPDGQTIAYLYATDLTDAGTISPWLVSAQGSAPPRPAVTSAESLTCQAWIIDELRGEWVVRPEWYPAGNALLVPVQERGQLHLYRLDIEHNTLQQLTSGNGRYISPQLSKNGQVVTMVRADWFTPGDIWSMDSTGKNLRKLTRINDAILQSHQLIRPKRITWQSFDGLEIEGWLYLPPQAAHTKVPLILAPHGGPSLAWGDAYVHEFQILAGNGYAVLAPNPRGSAGYSEEFSRKVLNDWGGGDYQDIMAGVEHVIATEPIDGERLGISGISYGGYMTNWAITQSDRFKAAVSRNSVSFIPSVARLSNHATWFALSMSDQALQNERSPLTFVDSIKTPLLLLHAENDRNCPLSEATQLFAALRIRKHMVELVVYHNAGHLMDWPASGTPQQRLDRLRRTLGWFAQLV